MDELLRDHGPAVILLFVVVLAAIIGAFYKLGWIAPRQKEWDGRTERRECTQHPIMNQKVCSLHGKLDDVEGKLDHVAERVQYILGLIEARWGRISKQSRNCYHNDKGDNYE